MATSPGQRTSRTGGVSSMSNDRGQGAVPRADEPGRVLREGLPAPVGAVRRPREPVAVVPGLVRQQVLPEIATC